MELEIPSKVALAFRNMIFWGTAERTQDQDERPKAKAKATATPTPTLCPARTAARFGGWEVGVDTQYFILYRASTRLRIAHRLAPRSETVRFSPHSVMTKSTQGMSPADEAELVRKCGGLQKGDMAKKRMVKITRTLDRS